MEHKPMELKDGWSCYHADFDCEEPYITMANNDSSEEEKVLIPETVAYYLRTHFCGSQKMRDLIEKHTVLDMQSKLKELLGIK